MEFLEKSKCLDIIVKFHFPIEPGTLKWKIFPPTINSVENFWSNIKMQIFEASRDNGET